MEKKQYEICLEVLRRFHKAGILNNFILIGSWCVYFYRDYFSGSKYLDYDAIKTRDLDFLINDPKNIRHEVDIPALLKDLGFVINFKGTDGYIKLDHPELIIEFLIPEKGKGTTKPVSLPKLGINAAALRFLSFLAKKTIKVKIEDFYLNVPDPVNFALHKLIISQRRPRQEKALKDKAAGIEILKALITKGEINNIKDSFTSIPKKWQSKIIKVLEENQEILEIFNRK